MTTVRIETNIKQVIQAFDFLGANMGEKVIRISLNTAMDRAYTTTKREISKVANISQGEIAKGLKKLPATGGSATAMIINTNHWYPAGYQRFKARQGSTGTKFMPWMDKVEIIEHGFMAQMKSGHLSIFKRGKRALRRGRNRSWLPIHDVGWGPNPAREMVREDHGGRVPLAIETVVATTLNTEVPRQVERLVDEAKSKFGV